MKNEDVFSYIIIGCSIGFFGVGGYFASMIRGFNDAGSINIIFIGIVGLGLFLILSQVRNLNKIIQTNKEFLEKEV